MKQIFTLLLTLLAIEIQAQEKSASPLLNKMVEHKCQPALLAGSADLNSLDLDWQPVLSRKMIEIEHPAPRQEYIDSIKAVLLKSQNYYKAYRNEPLAKITSVTPVVGNNFAGNTNNGMVPMDNSIAISNSGNIVSVANHTIGYYTTSGTQLYFKNITSFLPASLNVNFECDPVVIYDVRADRFVFFCQEYGTNFALFSNNRIIICFSKSNNPNVDGWWCYAIPGDPTTNGDAFDYPKLAVNDSELFVTGNLFTVSGSNSNFDQVVIFQINKFNGYSGTTLNYTSFTNTSDFSLLPVSYGQNGSFNPGMLFVTTQNYGGASFTLYQDTANLCCSPGFNAWTIPTTNYSVPVNSYQNGTSCLLNTGDCRALSGFWMNNVLHFVFNSTANGYGVINYNRLNTQSLINVSSTFGSSGYNYAYPAVASYATTATDKSVMIGFGRSGPTIFPEIRAVNCDDNMHWSASSILVHASSNHVGDSATSVERWGDYTGMARKHNSTKPSVWMNGMYGDAAKSWQTWIAEILDTSSASVVTDLNKNDQIKVYPNPVVKNFTVEFKLEEDAQLNISVIDMNEKTVKELFSGNGKQGDNVFSFNKANLANGIYFLIIRSNTAILKNEKIIINE